MKDILILVLNISIIVYSIYKNREILKELSKFQLVYVGISYLIATFFATILIYYGGNWITGQFSNILFKYIVFIPIICIVLYFCNSILNKALKKITNGLLPKN